VLARPSIYVLGRINFLGDHSFSPHMTTTAELCAAFEVGESTVHAKARVIQPASGLDPPVLAITVHLAAARWWMAYLGDSLSG
jgi:hypothetical protein